MAGQEIDLTGALIWGILWVKNAYTYERKTSSELRNRLFMFFLTGEETRATGDDLAGGNCGFGYCIAGKTDF